MNDTNTGRFVWYELMTKDPKGALAFYQETIGWKSQPFEGSDYTMWVGSQGPLGGVMELPEPAAKMGAPPHWMASVGTEDVDATVAKAKELGAKVYVEPMDMPGVGRYSVIADPQGAAIALFKPASAMGEHDSSKHGEFIWAELMTSDADAAFKFYNAIVGWEKVGTHDMGPMGVYTLYGRKGKPLGGMMNKPKEMPVSAFIYYVQVDDLEGAIARATSHGGKLLMGPMTVPGGSRVAQMMDPQGAMFALHSGVVGMPST